MAIVTKKRVIIRNVLVIAIMTLYCEYFSFLFGLWDTHTHLQKLVKEWESDDPQGTVVGQLRASLAAATWLGSLRPGAPLDPFSECGIPRTADGWWAELQRLAAASNHLGCLQDRMAAARAEHRSFKACLCCLSLLAVCGLAYLVVKALVSRGAPGVAKKEEEEGQGATRPCASSDTSSAEASDNSSGSFEMIEAPPKGAGHSLSREVLVSNVALRRLLRSCRWPLDMSRYSPRLIGVHRRLKEAMKAALFRRRRKVAKKKVGYDSLDWWRGADDGRGPLVVQPEERWREMFRPYPYPSLPHPKSVADPAEVFPRRDPPLGQQQHHQHGGQCHRAEPSRWEILLQLAIVCLLAYLCLSRGAAR